MPYIPLADRAFARECPETPGELNYAITRLVIDYLDRQGACTYENINACLGAMAGAQAEFYRRVAVPYEDLKLALHGDVFNPA